MEGDLNLLGVGHVLLNKCTNLESMDLPMSYEQFKFRSNASALMRAYYWACNTRLRQISLSLTLSLHGIQQFQYQTKPRRTYSWRINSQIAEKVSSIERYQKDGARALEGIMGHHVAHGTPRWVPSIVCSQDWRRKKKKNCFILIGHWWCRVLIYLFLSSWRCHHHHDIKTNFF